MLNVLQARSALANASKHGDDAAAQTARRALAAAKIYRAITEALASEFPPTEEQRERLAAMLNGHAA